MTTTIYNADCNQVLPSLASESVDLILTDPPYGIKYFSNFTDRNETIENDTLDELAKVLEKALPELKRVLKPAGVMIMFAAGGRPTNTYSFFEKTVSQHFTLITTLVWSKGKQDGSGMGLGWRYRPAYENILVVAKHSDKYNFYGPGVSNVMVCHPVQTFADRGDHPTQKPVPLLKRLILKHTLVGDTILDPFMGCGSTGIAAKSLGRHFIGIEMLEKYCKTADKRLDDTMEFASLLSCPAYTPPEEVTKNEA